MEQDDHDETTRATSTAAAGGGTVNRPIFVAKVDPSGSAARAGIQVGDVLVAVQNASVENQTLEYTMAFLSQAPTVVNLRFIRIQ